jgi:hypothetical protein
MAVSSHLEIFLTLFGWIMYDRFWDVILETGMGYLPFISLFFKNIAGPVKSQEAKDASSTSLRRIEIDLFAMLTVIVLCVQPVLTLEYTGLNYTKACSNRGAVVAGNTGTTYDDTFTKANLGGIDPKIPIWWYAVLAVTGGLNDAIVMAIPCTTDIRTISLKLENSRIKDPHLRRQVQRFFNECYNPAMSKFLKNNLSYPQGKADDLYWIGSDHLVNNLYKKERAETIVQGFKYDSNRDLEYDPDVHIPQYGKPTCYQWWTGNGHVNSIGLRDALKDQIDTSVLTKFKQVVSTLAGKSQTEVENIALRTLVSRESGAFNGYQGLSRYNDAGFGNMLNSVAATVGAFTEAASFYPTLYLIKIAAPIIQSVVLMLIYMLMPFYFWFSSYDIGKIVFMSIVVFSVKFWTVLWAVAHWLDNNMIEALDPGWFELFKNAISQGGQNNLVIDFVIGFVTGGLFVVAPLFWSGVLTWAGFKVGEQITNATKGMSDNAKSAGGKGGKAGLDAGKKIL